MGQRAVWPELSWPLRPSSGLTGLGDIGLLGAQTSRGAITTQGRWRAEGAGAEPQGKPEEGRGGQDGRTGEATRTSGACPGLGTFPDSWREPSRTNGLLEEPPGGRGTQAGEREAGAQQLAWLLLPGKDQG